MLFGLPNDTYFSVFKLRLNDLITTIKDTYPEKNGIFLLFAGFESDRYVFRQESSFYYLTGIKEPGVVLLIDLQGESILYIPSYFAERSKWVKSPISLVQENAQKIGVDTITVLGESPQGYQIHQFFNKEEYTYLLKRIEAVINQQGTVFTLMPGNSFEYVEQRLIVERLCSFIPKLKLQVVDISFLVAQMRRKKDMQEIEFLYKAVEITILSHEAAAKTIADQVAEYEVQANIEYIMTSSYACPSFPSIVASSKNGTILHYTSNQDTMRDGDLVVVDIGAEYNYYCADITRTYPVAGKFTKRQRELYCIVLETQEYIAKMAQPGYWLKNKDIPEKSLHHLAQEFLKRRGYDIYFQHGIGHYLGLDVHDVGTYQTPLQEGDVITIEPGIYIPQEWLGIRIEDDYWVVKDGVICLSEALPKQPDDIEKLVQQRLEE